MIAANETVKVLDRLGPDANVTMAEAKRIKDAVTEILDGEDGLKDGIVSCRTPSKAQQQKIEAALRTFLKNPLFGSTVPYHFFGYNLRLNIPVGTIRIY